MSNNSEESSPRISKFRKTLRIFTSIFVWTFILIFLFLAGFVTWMYTGERSIPFVAEHTAKVISDLLPDSSTLTIEDVLVTIDDNDIVLKVKNPVVSDEIRGDFELSEVDLRLDPIGFMPQSNRNILSIEISDPKLQLNKLLKAGESDEAEKKLPIEQINSYLNEHKKQLVKFSLSLNNTKFAFNISDDKVVEVVVNSFTIAPNIQNDKIVISTYGDINIAGNSNIIDLTVDTSHVKHLEFYGGINNLSTMLFESVGLPIKELAGSNLEVDLTFEGKTTSLRNIEYAKFDVSNFRGKIAKNQYFNDDVEPSSFSASGELFESGKKIQINDLDLQVGESSIMGKMNLDDGLFHADLMITEVTVYDLSRYWANHLIPRTRSWIFDTIKEGKISNAKVGLNLDFKDPEFPKKLTKEAYKVDLDIDNAVFQLDEKYPILTKIKASLSLNADELKIKSESAQIGEIKLSEFNGGLNKLGYADSTLSLKGNIEGKTKEVIDLAYSFSGKKNVMFADSLGNTKAEMKLKLKIFDDIKSLSDLNLEVAAKVTDFSNDKLVKGYPINAGRFEASFKDGVVSIDGNATIKDLSDVGVSGWVNVLDDSKSIKAYKSMSSKDIAKVGINPPNFISGIFDANVVAEQKSGSSDIDLKFNVILNESQVNVPQLNVLGKEGKKGYVLLLAKIKKEKFSIHSFDIKLSQLNGAGSIKLNAKNDVIAASSKKMRIGRSEFAFNYEKGKTTKLNIKGASFDLASFNINEVSKSNTGSVGGAITSASGKANINIPSYDISMSIDKLYLQGNEALYKPNIEFKSRDNDIKRVVLNAYTPAGAPIKLEYFAPRLVANFPDAGMILRGLGLYGNMDGGTMFISGLLEENNEFIGDLVITDFYIRKAPILAKILSLASVSLSSLSTLDSILGGKGMKFKKLVTKFRYLNKNIMVDDLVLKGPSLALTGDGTVDIGNDLINIKGTVIPETIINTAAKKIPVINKLLGADSKDEEALGVKFSVNGAISSPEVNVNPLSILAPGFLKKIIGE